MRFLGLGLFALHFRDHLFQLRHQLAQAGFNLGLLVALGDVHLGLQTLGGTDAQGVGLLDGLGFLLFLVPGGLGPHHLAGELGEDFVKFADLGFRSAFRVELHNEFEEPGLGVFGLFRDILFEKR